jgi:hypothetical protein
VAASPKGADVFGMAGAGLSKREGVFDHAVLNLHYDLDSGQDLFNSFGFKVAPRGYHSLGSINHLIVFETNYLELIGLDRANPNPRKELLDWPVGLNGLVIGSDDIEATRAQLQLSNLPVLEPKSFSRPVEIGGVVSEARFRTVHIDPSFFPASRLYFCEHLTPDLVWNPAFMQHPNTASCLRRLLVAAEDTRLQASHLARAVGAKLGTAASIEIGGTLIQFEPTQRLFDLYGRSIRLEGSLPGVLGMSIGVGSLNALKGSVESRWIGKLIEADPHRMIVPAAECFGVMLEFVETNVGAT